MQSELTFELDASKSHANVVPKKITNLSRFSNIPLLNDRGTPIASLPNELLPPILVEVINLEARHWKLSQKQRITWRRRVELTTVCKEWRRIALAYPVFWSGFWLRPRLQGLGQMLPRWKNYPRKTAVDSADFSAPIAEWSDFANLHTTELVGELRVIGPVGSAGDMDTFWNILSPFESAPETAPAHGAASIDSRTTFPNLRTLCLLELSPGPPSRILDVLLASRLLQEISIRDSIPSGYTPTFTWSHPPLRSCYLVTTRNPLDVTPLEPLLSRILTSPIPANLDLTVQAVDVSSNARTALLLEEMVQRIGSHLDTAFGRPGWDHLALTRTSAVARWSTGQSTATLSQPDDNGGLRLTFVLADDPQGWSLLRFLNATTITKLSLLGFSLDDSFSLHPEASWRSLFSRHPNIDTLVVEDIANGQRLLAALTPSAASGGSEAPSTLLLPKLQKITLHCYTSDNAKAYLDRLRTLALSRSEHARPISMLEFYVSDDCKDLQSAMANLRGRLADVTEVVDVGRSPHQKTVEFLKRVREWVPRT